MGNMVSNDLRIALWGCQYKERGHDAHACVGQASKWDVSQKSQILLSPLYLKENNHFLIILLLNILYTIYLFFFLHEQFPRMKNKKRIWR